MPTNTKPPIVKNWVKRAFRERIMIYGPPKIGKTHAEIDILWNVLNKDKTARAYVVNTDGSFHKTFISYCTIRSDIDMEAFADRIELIDMTGVDDVEPTIQYLEQAVKPNDWVCFDIAGSPWQWGQRDFARQVAKGKDIPYSQYIENAARDSKAFGVLDSHLWPYVKSVDGVTYFVATAKCNVIGIYEETITAVEEAKRAVSERKRSEKKDARKKPVEKTKDTFFQIWAMAGAKPKGNPSSAYFYDTNVYIYGEGEDRFFVVMGDRGLLHIGQPVKYNNFWQAFQKYRQMTNPIYASATKPKKSDETPIPNTQKTPKSEDGEETTAQKRMKELNRIPDEDFF